MNVSRICRRLTLGFLLGSLLLALPSLALLTQNESHGDLEGCFTCVVDVSAGTVGCGTVINGDGASRCKVEAEGMTINCWTEGTFCSRITVSQ